MIDVDALAQEIRRVDGNHDKGAAALAEALMPFLTAALAVAPAGIVNPVHTAPDGDHAMVPTSVDVHEGAWAWVIGTNGKRAGWIDTHALLAPQLYRNHILAVAPGERARSDSSSGLSQWAGWHQSRMPWSEAKHKDAVCNAVFGPAWSAEDAATLIGFIEATWPCAALATAAEGRDDG